MFMPNWRWWWGIGVCFVVVLWIGCSRPSPSYPMLPATVIKKECRTCPPMLWGDNIIVYDVTIRDVTGKIFTLSTSQVEYNALQIGGPYGVNE